MGLQRILRDSIITIRNGSCVKVMFSKASVILSTKGGGRSGRHRPGRHPLADPPVDGHCSERYASYWNAFLFSMRTESLASSQSCSSVDVHEMDSTCEPVSILHLSGDLKLELK